MPPRYYVPSVDTSARVLKMLSRYSSRESTLSEISVALGVPKATCLRVLKTLESHGLLQFDPGSKRYSLGYYCVVLGSRAEEGLDYLAYIRPLLREATTRSGLTSAFVQRVSTDRMMYVAKEEGGGPASVNVSIGNRFPVTEVSYGKWVVAFAPPAERDELLAGGLRPVTPNTITDIGRYLTDVEEGARQSVVVSESEYILGVTAVSCPVLDTSSRLVGVIALLGLSEDVRHERLDAVRELVRELASRARFDGRTTPQSGRPEQVIPYPPSTTTLEPAL